VLRHWLVVVSVAVVAAAVVIMSAINSRPPIDLHPHARYPTHPSSTAPPRFVCAESLIGRPAVELKKDVTIVVLGASGDLAKKKTVLPNSLLSDSMLTW
jgi:hypothetical protein